MPALQEPSVPAGATADPWDLDDPLLPDSMRSLNWSTHDTAKVGVGVDGFQYGDGTVARFVALYPGDKDRELDADDARELAAALVEAAAALDEIR